MRDTLRLLQAYLAALLEELWREAVRECALHARVGAQTVGTVTFGTVVFDSKSKDGTKVSNLKTRKVASLQRIRHECLDETDGSVAFV